MKAMTEKLDGETSEMGVTRSWDLKEQEDREELQAYLREVAAILMTRTATEEFVAVSVSMKIRRHSWRCNVVGTDVHGRTKNIMSKI